MLSYMVPTEDKPPPGPTSLDLPLTNGHPPKRIIKTVSKSSAISAESSASSLSSVLGGGEVAPTHGAKHKQPLNNGHNKHPTLKRVSFGSSKGSMVETLIYESPLQEESEPSPPASVGSSQGSDSSKAAKVRVTFFECERPQTLSSPEPTSADEDLDQPFTMSQTEAPPYNRQPSTDSGWDNPFRPDGDLSREADEIVELIKGGKPITPTAANGEAPKVPSTETAVKAANATSQQNAASPANGKAATNGSGDKAGQVELQRATVPPSSDASQVEHVNLKKKPKCKCCVIQ